MLDNFFGFKLLPKNKKERENIDKIYASPVMPSNPDGAYVSNMAAGAGWTSYILDVDGYGREENDLIQSYRNVARQPEAEAAIDDIVNEAIAYDDGEKFPVTIDIDTENEEMRSIIEEEFKEVLGLLRFDTCAYDLFKQWYVDGRLIHYMILDKTNPRAGIQEIRLVSPFNIRKVVEVETEKDANSVEMISGKKEYYIYTQNAEITSANSGIKLHSDSVSYITSGEILTNRPYRESVRTAQESGFKTYTISHLHKAIKPINQLRMLEDAWIIHRLVRAPERLVFGINTGNLSTQKSDEFTTHVKNMFRNKLVYDGVSGKVSENTNQLSMIDNIFLPKRADGVGVDVETIGGSQGFGDIDEVIFFRQKVYKALNVPISRMEPETGFSLGRSSEITRDEVKFSKFIDRLRNKFSDLFYDVLRIQLIAKGYTNTHEWESLKNKITIRFFQSSYFKELKDSEILDTRLDMLDKIQNYMIGDNPKFFTKEFVMRDILKFTEEEMANINKIETDQPPEGDMGLGGEEELPPGEGLEGEGNEEVEPEVGGENVAELFQK